MWFIRLKKQTVPRSKRAAPEGDKASQLAILGVRPRGAHLPPVWGLSGENVSRMPAACGHGADYRGREL